MAGRNSKSDNGGLGHRLGSWLRRIVPAGYAEATLNLVGTSPLLMKNGEIDQDSELARAYYLAGQKTKKTLDDGARLREMEWKLGLYLDEELGPFIPGKNIKEMLRAAATKWKKGEEIKRSLVVVENRIPLIYEGPRDQEGLWEQGFRYTTLVSNGGANRGRVYRCRPQFEEWSLSAEIAFDPEDLDLDFLQMVVERTQKYGLGDYRPQFGSFRAELVKGSLFKDRSNGSAFGKRDPSDEAAHQAFVDRIRVGA